MRKRVRIVGHRELPDGSNHIAIVETVEPMIEGFPDRFDVDLFLFPGAREFPELYQGFPDDCETEDLIFEIRIIPLKPTKVYPKEGAAP